MKIQIDEISLPLLERKEVRILVKRIDKINSSVSGNKWYKLKYNMLEAKRMGVNKVLTFGGAYSNHIIATAIAAKENGFASIGIIRGNQNIHDNPTISLAKDYGMNIYYIDRSQYENKEHAYFLNDLISRFGSFYMIPEGGTNKFGVMGAQEIIDHNDTSNYICCPVGTGGTISGIINSSDSSQIIIGFSAIRNYNDLEKKINMYTSKKNWHLINKYVLGGYARINPSLIKFINNFYIDTGVALDAIYTGKMMMGILDLISKDYFKEGSSILVIHSGGMQGNKGMNERFNLDLPCKS